MAAVLMLINTEPALFSSESRMFKKDRNKRLPITKILVPKCLCLLYNV